MNAMSAPYSCHACLHRQSEGDRCVECGDSDMVDLSNLSDSEHDDLIRELRRRAYRRRRKFIFAMEAAAIVLCAGFLYVGLTVAAGLGGGATNWIVKLINVALLAACWIAIPRIYDRHLRARPTQHLLELTGTSNPPENP